MKRAGTRLFGSLVSLAFVSMLSACGSGTESATSNANATVANIRLTPESRQIAVSETATFTAEALDAQGNVIPGRTFSFASTDFTVATVAAGSTPGQVVATGVRDGAATVTATIGAVFGTARLTVLGTPDVQVTGRVVDARSPTVGLAGARVEFDNGSSTTTGADGQYTFALARANDARISLAISRTGYVPTRFYQSPGQLQATGSPPRATLPTILLAQASVAGSVVRGVVRNASDGTGIAGATLSLSAGQGDQIGLNFVTFTTTDSQGAYSFTGLSPGTYSVHASPAGFANCAKATIAVEANDTLNQDVVCSRASDREVRIVLTWGSSPSDLDAHLTGPNVGDPGRFHVYFGQKGSLSAAPFASLDLDDRVSFGPETITITQLNAGVYRFSIHDFSNRSSATSTALAGSGARVELYLPSELAPRVFNVPNERGTLWSVFELTGPAGSPTVTVRNEMGLATDPEAIP